MAAKKGGLGKGLSAIFLENDNESTGSTVLPISEIEPNRSQPRHDFDEESLRELADSILWQENEGGEQAVWQDSLKCR